MSNELQQAVALFFKYNENDDIEMMKLYCQLLSETSISFVKARLASLMKTRNKSYKMPSIAEILEPLTNSECQNAWETLMLSLKDPYEKKTRNVISLIEYLGGRRRLNNLSPVGREKLMEQFYKTKYEEFKLFLRGDIKIPKLTSNLNKIFSFMDQTKNLLQTENIIKEIA